VLGCPWRIDFSRAQALVDGVERQGHFDEFFAVLHGSVCFPVLLTPEQVTLLLVPQSVFVLFLF